MKEAVSDAELQTLYQNCEALLMPGEEDFGIVALEANSYGKPVIINKKSGAAELILNSVHGIHLRSQTVPGIIVAIEKLAATRFKTENLIKNAQKYDTNIFKEKFCQVLEKLIEAKRKPI